MPISGLQLRSGCGVLFHMIKILVVHVKSLRSTNFRTPMSSSIHSSSKQLVYRGRLWSSKICTSYIFLLVFLSALEKVDFERYNKHNTILSCIWCNKFIENYTVLIPSFDFRTISTIWGTLIDILVSMMKECINVKNI